MKILVTGGAGYIGSHVARQLGEQGHDLVTYDNLSTGHKKFVLYGELVVADLADREKLDQVIKQNKFDAVLHFAASIIVSESVEQPFKYYSNNTVNTLGLIDACVRHGVPKFVFSSTAAVYGIPDTKLVDEQAPLLPINPYGTSKMMSELILMDHAAISDLHYVILRYFNVAGADPEGRMGQAMPEATHLIKVACETALGKRAQMEIYGTDYDTEDGTCIRDYIHIEDLASAHLSALDYLNAGNDSSILNCGYGQGYSVREVVDQVKRVSGQDFKVIESGRRAGDPPALMADNHKILATLDWQPQYADLAKIVQSAYDWEKGL
jgi:UDP-glucose 4-epimerase